MSKPRNRPIIAATSVALLVALLTTATLYGDVPNEDPMLSGGTVPSSDAKVETQAGEKTVENIRKARYKEVRRREIEDTFGANLNELDLSEDLKREILELIVQRREIVDTVNELSHVNEENEMGAARSGDRAMAAAKAREASESRKPKAIRSGQQAIDDNIRKIVKPETFERIREILRVEFELAAVSSGFVPMFERDGHPLSAPQRLALASALHAAYSTKENPAATLRYSLPVNAAGLTELDELFFEHLAGKLEIEQIGALQTWCVVNNRRARQ